MFSTHAASQFLKSSRHFRLGILPTEQSHPKTKNLAVLSKTDLAKALDILRQIDLSVIAVVLKNKQKISSLTQAIQKTWSTGGRVFLYGCGATGRLSLSLEHIWRSTHLDEKADRVRAFMSGGDVALVHSIENFEDHPEYGARQLREIGFTENDLLICTTEGGETPSVIGATEEATRISKWKPWFLYCNPDAILKKHIPRSRRILNNKGIEKVSLFVGPMSLSGSTRLQATTALQLFVGQALFADVLGPRDLQRFLSFCKKKSYAPLIPFIEKESQAYLNGNYLLYSADRYAITVMTDTTERSPTFSLPGFENQKSRKTSPAYAYVYLPKAKNCKDAWKLLLLRKPLTLEWRCLNGAAGAHRLYGFDFSGHLPSLRRKKIGPKKKQHLFRISRKNQFMHFSLEKINASFDVASLHPLYEHLFLKLLLNAHSTLIMGRLGRFEGNVMTWVRPSNYKLIDRAIRYVAELLKRDGICPTYQEIAQAIFQASSRLGQSDSVVMATVELFKRERKAYR